VRGGNRAFTSWSVQNFAGFTPCKHSSETLSFAMNTTYLSRISVAYLPRLVGRGGECGTATYWWQPRLEVYRRSGLENYMAVVASTQTEQTCRALSGVLGMSWP